ncbi:MAG: class-II fumarase/aspartase family protein [Hyphomicrobiaceae bacterium]
MPAISLFDWQIYRNLFSDGEMEDIFGERRTIESWIKVERAVARAQADLGIIPAESGAHIDAELQFDRLDLERLRQDTLEVGRPIAGLVRQLAEQVGEGHDVWVHYGITTYDVMDTGKVLQVRNGLDLLTNSIDHYCGVLGQLASAHRDTVMIGRTNNLHAQPTTFGAKIANWIEEFLRHRERLEEAKKRVLLVQFGGAVGTLASLDPLGLEFRASAAAELGLGTPMSNWHNARDGMTEVALCQANICASLARIAQNLNSLSSTEIGEVSEAGEVGRGRSTSMAHKRNPRAAEFAEAVARLGRQRATGMVEVMGQEHDRCGGTWISEWMLLPETFLLTSGALRWAINLVERLDVHPEQMARNIDLTRGLALTERFTLALAARMSKFEARRLLDSACARVREENTTLVDALGTMPEVLAVMSRAEIEELSDSATYVGSASQIVDNVLDMARRRQ